MQKDKRWRIEVAMLCHTRFDKSRRDLGEFGHEYFLGDIFNAWRRDRPFEGRVVVG